MPVKNSVDSDFVRSQVVKNQMRKLVPERPDTNLELAKALTVRLEPVSHLRLLNDSLTEPLVCRDEIFGHGVEFVFDEVVDVAGQVFLCSSFSDQSSTCHYLRR